MGWKLGAIATAAAIDLITAPRCRGHPAFTRRCCVSYCCTVVFRFRTRHCRCEALRLRIIGGANLLPSSCFVSIIIIIITTIIITVLLTVLITIVTVVVAAPMAMTAITTTTMMTTTTAITTTRLAKFLSIRCLYINSRVTITVVGRSATATLIERSWMVYWYLLGLGLQR